MSRICMSCLFWVLVHVEVHGLPITPSSDNLSTLRTQQIAELWAEYCWKESGALGTEDVVSKLKRLLGSLESTITVSCEEAPEEENTSNTLQEIEYPSVQKQVIFVEIPDHSFVYRPPAPPRVVIYVLPPEESHVFNIIDNREVKVQEPQVRFLSHGVQENQRLARGVVPPFGDDFEIIRAISYWGDS